MLKVSIIPHFNFLVKQVYLLGFWSARLLVGNFGVNTLLSLFILQNGRVHKYSMWIGMHLLFIEMLYKWNVTLIIGLNISMAVIYLEQATALLLMCLFLNCTFWFFVDLLKQNLSSITSLRYFGAWFKSFPDRQIKPITDFCATNTFTHRFFFFFYCALSRCCFFSWKYFLICILICSY